MADPFTLYKEVSSNFSSAAVPLNNAFNQAINGQLNLQNQIDSITGASNFTAAALQSMNGTSGGVAQYGVKLVSRQNPNEVFFCDITPTIDESGDVSYESINIIQGPGTIEKYTGTSNRSWSIGNIKLVSLTVADADKNQALLNRLRGWRMPYYGSGTAQTDPARLGAPPAVLMFSAYGDNNIGNIPVVLTSLTVPWPNDVDFIHTSDFQPFPVILTLSISLKETWSPSQFSGFSLADFKDGNMAQAYNAGNAYNSSKGGANPNDGTLQKNTDNIGQ